MSEDQRCFPAGRLLACEETPGGGAEPIWDGAGACAASWLVREALAQVVRVPVGADGVAAAGPAVMLARGFCAPGDASATAVRHRPTYSQANGWAPLTNAVQHAEDPGRVLMVSVSAAHHGNWMLMPSMAIRPATVAASVDVDARGVRLLACAHR